MKRVGEEMYGERKFCFHLFWGRGKEKRTKRIKQNAFFHSGGKDGGLGGDGRVSELEQHLREYSVLVRTIIVWGHGWGCHRIFRHLCSAGDVTLRLFISFGAAFGIFASSSGGGNPCLFSSGGGPLAWAAIFSSAFVGLCVVDTIVPLASTSVISSSAIAAGVGCVVGGFASSVANRVSGEVRKKKKGRRKEAVDVEKAAGGSCQGECCGGGKNVSNSDLQLLSRNKLVALIAEAGREELENVEVVTRTLAVLFICGGLRLAYAMSEGME